MGNHIFSPATNCVGSDMKMDGNMWSASKQATISVSNGLSGASSSSGLLECINFYLHIWPSFFPVCLCPIVCGRDRPVLRPFSLFAENLVQTESLAWILWFGISQIPSPCMCVVGGCIWVDLGLRSSSLVLSRKWSWCMSERKYVLLAYFEGLFFLVSAWGYKRFWHKINIGLKIYIKSQSFGYFVCPRFIVFWHELGRGCLTAGRGPHDITTNKPSLGATPEEATAHRARLCTA